MKVLVIGNGGREHTLAWCLAQSPKVHSITCIPGNGGTANLKKCRNLALGVTDFEGIERFATVNNVGLMVVGPEVPLAAGFADYFLDRGFQVFGPRQAGAQIESSKAWAKALMQEAGIPTAKAEVLTAAADAKAYVSVQGAPIVVKADGLAAGKGVTVAQTVEEAHQAIDEAFGGRFGSAGDCVVVEECLQGQEASVLAITDGLTIRPLVPAQDHKAVGEGDTGANTGGMGAYAPTPVVSEVMLERIQAEVLEPAIATLRNRDIDYCGVLYAGLMITPEGDPKVIEFNCRFGDPETQVVLPLLETPLESLLLACVQQKLAAHPPIEWKEGAAACVVLASGGYPDTYKKGFPITGIGAAEATGAMVFHAGTRLGKQGIVTDGGRVLGVTALGDTFGEAIAQAYAAVDLISFEAMYCRRDIGFRVLGQS
ncbi:MAG: phosphoribosylamine--glycine ligase [Cyanothece sp. SIO2G6]|nr:phosphoribosylamine--glycine ligase [Cyanothece sp. SIO2G6]